MQKTALALTLATSLLLTSVLASPPLTPLENQTQLPLILSNKNKKQPL